MGQLLPYVLLALCSALSTEQTASASPQDQDAVLVEDLDDFAQWSFAQAGLPYDSSHEFNIKVGSRTDPWLSDLQANGRVTILDEDELPVRSHSFLEVSSAQNPFNRDADELDTSKGKEARDGKLNFLLVSTFNPEVSGSGQVWMVPRHDKSKSFVLLGGVETPTGLCFDKNHNFLYVCDPAQASIFQYSVRVTKHGLILNSDQVATVYQGFAPTDCAVDAYGHLYFTDLANNTISRIEYSNLWAGFVDQQQTLYQRTETPNSVDAPLGIDVADRTLYWVNSADFQDSGVLVSGAVEGGRETILLRDEMQPRAVTVSKHFVHFVSQGQVWAYLLGKERNLLLKSSHFSDPRGICQGEGHVYVTDLVRNRVMTFKEGWEEEAELNTFLRIVRPYGIVCINL